MNMVVSTLCMLTSAVSFQVTDTSREQQFVSLQSSTNFIQCGTLLLSVTESPPDKIYALNFCSADLFVLSMPTGSLFRVEQTHAAEMSVRIVAF